MAYRCNFTVFITATTLCTSLNCEHDCKSSLEGGVCTCPKGKKVANDSKSCIGKNEWKPRTDVIIYFEAYGYIFIIKTTLI